MGPFDYQVLNKVTIFIGHIFYNTLSRHLWFDVLLHFITCFEKKKSSEDFKIVLMKSKWTRRFQVLPDLSYIYLEIFWWRNFLQGLSKDAYLKLVD